MLSLSILLPTYNCSCVSLVTELQRQCAESGADYEVIVADDGSPDQSFIAENKAIERLAGVTYIIRQQNVGRSAIRNFLVAQAHHEWLLFIDGDLSLDNPNFIRNYLRAEGEVIVGGITIGGDETVWKNNLRYRYERAYEQRNKAQERQLHAAQHFRTTNFLACKSVMLSHPFDEHFQQYGYEDVLLGKTLEKDSIPITHIDNPIMLDSFETNSVFLAKTEESLRTLHTFRKQLEGYSTLLRIAGMIRKKHLTGLILPLYKIAGKWIKHSLQGNKPSVFLFNVYKLMYYIHYEKDPL
ncbi:MAG: glycosyltransferase family 2 protein [Prevotella sp.]|nr:glycosyltransferase family 2 protein [Prevotella sp.]